MAKVAIKNVNITFFGGIYHIMDFFKSWAFKNLPNLYWVNVEVAAKHSVMEVFFVVIIFPHWFGWGILCLCKTQEPQKIPISMDKSKNVTSIYKSTSQGIMLWN